MLLLHFGGVWQLRLKHLNQCIPQQVSEVGTVFVAHCVWTQEAVVGLYQRSSFVRLFGDLVNEMDVFADSSMNGCIKTGARVLMNTYIATAA